MGTPGLSPTEALTKRVEALEQSVRLLATQVEVLGGLLRDALHANRENTP